MRIENNNNLAFGAYFKNNANLKRLLSSQFEPKKDLVDKFLHKLPDHELEIVDIKTEQRCSNFYTLFNNTIGQGITIHTNHLVDYGLHDILTAITDKTSIESKLLFKKNRMADFYKTITKQK